MTHTPHSELLVIDMASATNPAWPTPARGAGQVAIRAKEAGVTSINATISAYTQSFRQAIAEVNRVRRFIEWESDTVMLVTTADDIRTAKASSKLGITIAFQTGSPFEDDWLNTLPVLHQMGLRVSQLTYNEQNLIGSGCREPRDQGLTFYGQQVVSAFNSTGVIVDVSHVGWKTSSDAAKLSTAPIIASHSNAFEVTPHPRNLPDDLAKAIADTGGVIGVVAWEVLNRPRSGGHPTLDDFFRHMDHFLELVGEDHVGVGTDFNENFAAEPVPPDFALQYGASSDRSISPPAIEGFGGFDDFPNLTAEMVKRGYSESVIRKVLGENFLRVAETVWQ
ncbi:dipeptidase [Microbacterium pseudoresistens]|uniref:Membrane dipeptidase n=1 Tax=Microbacterium pseudoresistens TaxID=640634 RepID=A0A7Y9ETL1_9MICO|nr:membrane dipeptidase [Microbacterium pseudoresistens]NYD53714.1 membrane dipeptidase [Microbacterium pseudoresistens]